MITSTYDIVISGGGAVGLTLAMALSQGDSPPRILILDSTRPPNNPVPNKGQVSNHEKSSAQLASAFDGRRFALSLSSIHFLQTLGLWQALQPYTVAIEEILVWQSARLGRTHISAQEEGLAALGAAVTFQDLGRVLSRAVARLSNETSHVTWYQGAKLKSPFQRTETGWQLEIETLSGGKSEVCQTGLLVVAEGVDSETRSALGVNTQVYDYQQMACVLPCQMSAGTKVKTAYECFTPSGSLAVLPGQDETRWLVWALPNEEAKRGAADPKALLKKTQKALGRRLRVKACLGEPALYPLRQVIADEQVRPHLLLLGNAAHSLHPIAGQGFNLAVRDIALLYQMQQTHGVAGFTSYDVLKQYAAQRAQDQQRIQQFCHGLVNGFRFGGSGASVLRSLGLMGFDAMPGAKQYLAQEWIAPTPRWQEDSGC